MLKITYSDSDITIEELTMTVETVVAQRGVLALRVGQPIMVQPSYGSFLLPADLPGVESFLAAAEPMASFTVAPCDYDWLEVTLRGTWIADAITSQEGILVAELGGPIESQIVALWQQSRTWVTNDCCHRLPKTC